MKLQIHEMLECPSVRPSVRPSIHPSIREQLLKKSCSLKPANRFQ